MARSKRKRGSSKSAYQSIRKPVPPPSKVEKDRRRKIREDIERRELRKHDDKPNHVS